MKNITLSAEERLIEAARERACSEHTTLNAEFRAWLAEYAKQEQEQRLSRYDAVVEALRGRVRVGRKMTRDEMNAR